KLFMLTPERGAQAILHCALSFEAARETGLYYDQSRLATPSALAQETALALQLWQRSEEWIRNDASVPSLECHSSSL
nr:hypothetical protein [Acidobacteriota bacterium]